MDFTHSKYLYNGRRCNSSGNGKVVQFGEKSVFGVVWIDMILDYQKSYTTWLEALHFQIVHSLGIDMHFTY